MHIKHHSNVRDFLRRGLASAFCAFALITGLPAGAQELEKVRIAHSTESLAFLPFFTAVTMDKFKEVGIDVEVIRAGGGSKTIAAIVGGSTDLAVSSTSGLMFARKEGIDIKMTSALVNQYVVNIVYSKQWAEKHAITADSSYEDRLKALRGARIATSGPGGGQDIVMYMAAKAGLDGERDLTMVHLGNDIGVYRAALDAGQIDGLALSAPTPEIAIKEQGAQWAFNFSTGEVSELNGYLYLVASASQAWLAKNPETARKVDQAFQATLDLLHDPAQSPIARDKVRAKYYPDTDEALFAVVWDQAVKMTPRSTRITVADVEGVVRFTNEFEKKNPLSMEDAAQAVLQLAN